MKKYSFFAFALVAALFIADKAHAVGERCTHTSGNVNLDTSAPNQGSLQTCSTDAVGMEYTFNSFGVCDGYPTLANGFANCQAFLNTPTTVDLASGTGSTNISGFIPDPGDYDYFFAITAPNFEVTGEIAMASATLASNADLEQFGHRYQLSSEKRVLRHGHDRELLDRRTCFGRKRWRVPTGKLGPVCL